ncbi:hypothetical protein [Bradyrhizobium japonicum]|uniref:hypothetical protein n=1 Tax=Bradyrhizobium japonicum TaxID=375 RepID=UPI00209C8F02|nr:hypothetical protein [Bradyrhizobium japonicum]MCP1761916.1 ribosomal protein S27AE [Bradyrhizobium japonicum]MCP1793496.1 ribosomal protein S27AE [Bradyrhizobium japonicum]MCP1805929.1 ribosomal protein S27AE [Bradyrhizobium japonicum]MCP1812332.1 ribosomal protein S27AE [Bradyrhizobium japonicum]MCP1873625.1 ribosomal protein S27AE [Bradyrhizobium japonicum]
MTMIEDIDREHPDYGRIIGALRADRCPDCDASDMIGGPRGGASQNLFCGRCGSGFNVAQPRYIMLAQRIGRRQA